MGNTIGKDETRGDDDDSDGDGVGVGNESVRSNGDIVPGENHVTVRYHGGRSTETDVRRNAFAQSDFPVGSRSPILISPQFCVPIAPLQRSDGPPSLSQNRQSDSQDHEDTELGIPTIITWNYGGNDVLVEGSWDNWTLRKRMQRSSKDFSVLVVLPSGIYHYIFIIDGEYRYIPELPHITDDKGRICNLMDVHFSISKESIASIMMKQHPESISEFVAPPSPELSYGQAPSSAEDFAKEPSVVPPQLHLTVLGPENLEEPAVPSLRPQHVVLNHLFLEKGMSSQSVVALGLTHRFESKYVTVVLYKPVKR